MSQDTPISQTEPRNKSKSGIDISLLTATIMQLSAVLESLSQQHYVAPPANTLSGTIGQHTRHSLDHINAWLTGIQTGKIDYEKRLRGTDIETDRVCGLRTIAEYQQRLNEITEDELNQPVQVVSSTVIAGNPIEVQSSAAREMLFVLSHTTHHNATIRAMATALGVSVPEDFGYAPSTIAYMKQTTCAQ